MQKEIEAKFLNSDHEIIRTKLSGLGARCYVPMRLMRRTTFDFPDRRLNKNGSWVRLREELDGTVELMLKSVKAQELGQTFEQPVVVNNYEAAIAFLLAIGLEIKSEQESKREVWLKDDTEIMLDTWPWVPSFIEIEGKTESAVQHLAQELGLDWSDARFGSITPVFVDAFKISAEEFEALDIPIKFNEPIPSVLSRHTTK